MQKRNLRTGRFLWLGSAVILLLIPFHAFFTAWLASSFGHYDLIRLWKEVILLILALGTLVLVCRHPALRKDLQQNRIVQLCLGFIGFIVLMAAVGLLSHNVSLRAALYGVIIDTRSFVFLLVLLVAGHMAPLPITRRRWILVPATLVVAFGLLQLFVLPHNFLVHFGYGPHTLPAFQPVDNKPELARLQSTLRGPNPLGAYLLPIIMVTTALAYVSKKRRLFAVVFILLATIVMYASYSRSAAVGLIVSGWLYAFWSITKAQTKQLFIGITLLLIFTGLGLLWGLRHNDTFQNLAFHTNEKSTAISTNSVRLKALKTGLKDVVKHPFGSGVGSAGPASVRNRFAEPRISENYFIQIGQEAGVIGIMLFAAVLITIWRVLYPMRSDNYVRAVLATLVGIILVNMVSHAFADDTLAYVLFALIGFELIRTTTHPIVVEKLAHKSFLKSSTK